MSGGTLFLYIIGGLLAMGLLDWRMGSQGPTTHGSSRWGSVWDLLENGLLGFRGLIVGEWLGDRDVRYSGPHAITFGSTGSGKGSTIIVPNLLTQRRIFMVDPGGENTAIACKYWRDQGYEFRCINFFGMHERAPWSLPAHGFNPLDALDPDDKSFAAKTAVLTEMLVLSDARDGGSTVYFKNTARAVIVGLIIHIKTTEPRARQNLATLYNYLHLGGDGWGKLVASMLKNPAVAGLVRNEGNRLARLEAQSPEEFSGVVSTMQDALGFLADPVVREKFASSDTDFGLLKSPDSHGVVISVVLPLDAMETHAAVLRLAMGSAVLTMQRAPFARKPVLFLIDEAAALGRIARLPNWHATLRKYQVTLWTFWQDTGQLADLYGNAWRSIVGNCGLLQITGVQDHEMAVQTEKMLGQCTIMVESKNDRGQRSSSPAARPLMFSDEVRRMEKDKSLAIIENLLPVKFTKRPYWERPALNHRYHPNPFHSFVHTDGTAEFRHRLRVRVGKVYWALVWWMDPHPISAVVMLGAFALWVSRFF